MNAAESWIKTLMITGRRVYLLSGDDDVVSETDYPAARPRYGQPERASSRAMLPLRRLDTLRESPVDGDGEQPPQVDFVDERWVRPGRSGRPGSSSSDSRVPARRRAFDEPGEEPGREGDPQDPEDDGTRNPLLRRSPWNPHQP